MSSGFCIKDKESNHTIDFDILDKMVCNKFELSNLNPIDDDYGYYVFPESNEDGWRSGQDSVSWVGLLHCVAYYTSIRRGQRSKIEIMGALYEMLTLAIDFPPSTIVFLSQLLDFLDQNGMFVFFEYSSSRKELPLDGNIFKNKRRMYLRNESGLFECNDQGKLLNFFPDSKNLMDKTKVKEIYRLGGKIFKDYYRPCVYTLIIPEGVTTFECDFFRGGLVNDIIRFPSTLRQIGSNYEDCVFAGSFLPEVIIPRTVKMIGNFAFGASHIKRLVFEDDMQCMYARQFKESVIEELVIPHAMWERNDGVVVGFKMQCKVYDLILT